MRRQHATRFVATLLFIMVAYLYLFYQTNTSYKPVSESAAQSFIAAYRQLEQLEVKGRAPKTGYERSQFGDGWANIDGCDMRNIILARDLKDIHTVDNCHVLRGSLNDPYTGEVIQFVRGPATSTLVQIDHVVALSNAWQTGAQQLSPEARIELANDPLELVAVSGTVNQAKSDFDAATWLPPNKAYRCDYVTRQIQIKAKYGLWVTSSEKDAMKQQLDRCI